jgi:signal transduction histidine kinase/HAMP domain-containing protein/ActR/RegA family two-component response regulator
VRIRSQFRLTLVIFCILLIATSALVVVVNRLAELAGEVGTRASNIALGASELGYLANDYVIYQEVRQLERWKARFLAFANDLAALDVGDPEERALLRDIKTGERRLKEVFDSVVSTASGLQGNRSSPTEVSLRVSWSRLSVQTQSMVSDALRLSRLSRQHADELKQYYSVALLAMLAAFGAYVLINYLSTQRRALASIAMLQRGATVVGSGNLDFRIPEKTNDEIGDLAKAFNRMAVDLRERTAELLRANQTLHMVSECNQAMVRAREEMGLVEGICRIIKELGGYRMVWVGYAADDPCKTVRPVAWAGKNDGFLEHARITWGDVERGQGPTGSAIRLGQVRRGMDFLSDPELAPWREMAIERGYRSSLALPLMSEGQAFGALTIFTDRLGAFADGEVKLLVELSDDLSFGISALRTRTERVDALRLAEERAGQLRALAAELENAEQKERRRLSTVLHDHLQQLLVGGKFGLSTLQGDGRPAREQEAVNRVMEALDEAILLTRSLTVELSPPALHERGLAGGLEWLGREMKRVHDLTVLVEVDPAAEPAAEDLRVFFYQAVRELLFNVVKHAKAKTARVELSSDARGRVRVSVADSGKGFDPNEVENGGFGLFSIRERLGYLGGEMTVESAPGAGARFTLTISAETASTRASAAATGEKAAPAGSEAAAGAPAGAGAKIRVLLADDHQVIRQGLTVLLQALPDIEVVGEAGDGEEAIEMTRRLSPDVVLMDVSMPRLNGYEATRRITSELPGVRVVCLSMHEDADMAAAMHEAGAVAYLNKGGPAQALIAIIRAQGSRRT